MKVLSDRMPILNVDPTTKTSELDKVDPTTKTSELDIKTLCTGQRG
jgi:hypothetical protein